MHDLHPIFEDNHLLVLNKSAGLLTQPSGTVHDSLEQQAKAWIKKVHHKPGNVFLHAVHRLDRAVSGIVVFAKTSKALARLNALMREKQTRKIYWAWVEGSIKEDKGKLENFIAHDDFHAKIVNETHQEAKIATLNYQVLKRLRNRSLVEIELETGRYHQIRLQFSAFGHPIWGDHKYGSHEEYHPHAIALHHFKLELMHPVSKQKLVFEAPLPKEFVDLNGRE